ncbi:hypothetical protein HBH98_087720 [Parastagonospora nodorum]|nr:hypothetical protein HBI10_114500 [Parastagonospora nodorum]KAH4013162.1 hypothetical protein HBI13_180550 [Parastagonospora nodorum]KAH4035230.1 hypothetical protein HBI09_096950 [Parastagonospora nodorum]KAH4347944.1 hypothetical protein HBH98_087720 [Parastagonospora nodorum]KAH4377369.1 hypothetical protein HBH97_108220 [Parastagonospora nodorum]
MKISWTAPLLLYGEPATISSSLESRFGLSFSPTTIIASRFNAIGSIELHSFPASASYQEYYQEAVEKDHALSDDFDEARVKSIFESNVIPINTSLTEQLGHTPEFATLFTPSIFDWKTILAAGEAVFKDAQYMTRAAPSRQAACYGFGFLQCRNLERSLSECNDHDPESLVLLFEYEKEYLYVWLVWVSFELEVHSAEHEKICKDCGEELREAIGEAAYQERINKFVQDFLVQHVLPEHKREDIRAIIIAGEASAAAVKELGDAALEVVGTEEVKLLTDFEPSEVVAHGAAVFSRLTQEHPEHFGTTTGNIIPDDKEWAEMQARIERENEGHSEL